MADPVLRVDDPLFDGPNPPTPPSGTSVTANEIHMVVAELGLIAGAIILLIQGKTDEGVKLLMASAGTGVVFTTGRSVTRSIGRRLERRRLGK